jgi:hypothetical protein
MRVLGHIEGKVRFDLASIIFMWHMDWVDYELLMKWQIIWDMRVAFRS